MPPDDSITVGELVRRLDEFGRRVERRLDEFMVRMETMTKESQERDARLTATFLPRREYELQQETAGVRETVDATHMRGLESEVHKVQKRLEEQDKERREQEREDARFRKQMKLGVATAVLAPMLILLLSALLQARGLA